jgi:rsbT co-antagonist protein RsbR
MMRESANFSHIFKERKGEILEKWMKQQAFLTAKTDITEEDLHRQCAEFLDLLEKVVGIEPIPDLDTAQMQPIVQFLQEISRQRVLKGLSHVETATFILSLKEVLLPIVHSVIESEEDFMTEVMPRSILLDKLGLVTFEYYLSSREEMIARQQQAMAETSIPVMKIWEGILALPLIGMLDSKRTLIVMEELLQKIVETAATAAILDVTGVPTIDTPVANHIMKTVAATRLLGAECIITGISPAVAQTIVHLGVDLSGVLTRSSMPEGLKLALRMLHQQIVEDCGGTALGVAEGEATTSRMVKA